LTEFDISVSEISGLICDKNIEFQVYAEFQVMYNVIMIFHKSNRGVIYLIKFKEVTYGR